MDIPEATGTLEGNVGAEPVRQQAHVAKEDFEKRRANSLSMVRVCAVEQRMKTKEAR